MVAFASAGLFAFGGTTTSSVKTHVLGTDGIRAVVPVTWHLSHEVLSVCSSLAQVMAITNVRGPVPKRLRAVMVLILLLEDRYGRPSSFAPRTRFHVTGSPGLLAGCCDIPVGPGQEFVFRDHGRNLYAFVYVRGELTSAAEAALNSLEVSAR